MTEPQKKRTIHINLLIILVAILGFSSAYIYSNLQREINVLNADKTSLQNQITKLTSQKNTLNTTYQNYVSNHSYTNTQYNIVKDDRDLLFDIVNLQKSQVLLDNQQIIPQEGYFIYWNFEIQYAGYLQVKLETSNSTNNYVEVVYSSHGVEYDELQPIIAGGSAYFPVLPSTVQIRIGTTVLETFTGNATVTLYY